MAYTANTSRRVPAGTLNISTFGADADGRDYGPSTNGGVNGWLTAVASSTAVERLDVYLESGQSYTLYTDSFGTIPAQSGPRIIRPAGVPGEASWQGHNGTRLSGVGFDGANTADTYTSFLLVDKVHLFDLIMKAKPNYSGVSLPSSGSNLIVGNIIYNTAYATSSRAGVTGGLSGEIAYVVNNIIEHFYSGVRGQCGVGSVLYNNTIIDCASAPVDWASGNVGRTHYYRVFNNVYYGNGAAPIYNSDAQYNGTNVTLSGSSDLVDYAGHDYHLAGTASEALGQGTDFSADATFDFDDDIDNTSRTAWDIGADGYAIPAANADLETAWDIVGFSDLETAWDIVGFSDLETAWNIGIVVANSDLATAWDIIGFANLNAAWDILGCADLATSWHIYGSVLGYSPFTPEFRRNIFQAALGVASFTPINLYLGLSTSDPLEDGSGITEPAGNNYSRVQVTTWGTPSGGVIATSAAVRTPRASGDWGTITHIFWADAPAGGNIIGGGQLFGSYAFSGDADRGQAIVFQSGSLSLGIDTNVFHGYINSMLSAIVSGAAIPTGDISYGLALNTPDPDGTFTEVTATGYGRVVNNDVIYTDGIFTNTTSIDFPVVQSGSDWGTVGDYIMLIDDVPFSFLSMTETDINYSSYGVTGFKIPANAVVIGVI